MDIAELSTDMSQLSFSQEASMKVTEMSLDNADVQAQALGKLMASAEVVTDPSLGQVVDLLA